MKLRQYREDGFMVALVVLWQRLGGISVEDIEGWCGKATCRVLLFYWLRRR